MSGTRGEGGTVGNEVDDRGGERSFWTKFERTPRPGSEAPLEPVPHAHLLTGTTDPSSMLRSQGSRGGSVLLEELRRHGAWHGPALAVVIGLVLEGLAWIGAPLVSPGILLLLPVVVAAAGSAPRVALATGLVSGAFLAHLAYVADLGYDSAPGALVTGDLVRLLTFFLAVVFLAVAAQFYLRRRIAEREAAAERQRAFRWATYASQTKSQFLAVMSHELRTPLTTVVGYCDLLEAEVAGRLTDEQREYLERIESASHHLLSLISQVLDFARAEGGGLRAQPERFDLTDLVRRTCFILEPEARQRDLALQVAVPTTAVEAETDAGKLRQILVNLVGNAIKFTQAGRVTVTLRQERTKGMEVVLEVRDTGIGIDEADLPHIFEPFWQAEPYLTRRYEGSGLGLAVTRELVLLLGGTIEARSTPGTGSTFTVRLPRTIPPWAAERVPEASTAASGPFPI